MTNIDLPIAIPEGSVILSTSPLQWREPDGTECTLSRVEWKPDGWHVEISAVKGGATCCVTIGNDALKDQSE